MEFLIGFLNDFIDILNEMSPYLMLGFLFAGILKVAFPQRFIDRYLGQRNSRSVFNAALIGVPLPLCSCGVIPTGISLFKNGATKGSSVSFLISTPQTGIDSILVTYSLLGLPFAIIRPIIAMFTGFAGGILANRYDKKEIINNQQNSTKNSHDKENNHACDKNSVCCATNNSKKHSVLYTMFKYAFVEFLEDISKWLIIGLLLAAFISVIIPDDFFSDFIGNDLIGMLVILLFSIPLYICATASVPVAAVLLMKGLSPGAALILLMAGPATNAATITVLNKVLGRKTMLAYLFSIIAGAIVFGLFIDYFLPREWFTLGDLHSQMGAHEGHFMLPKWVQWGSSIILASLILNVYLRKIVSSKEKSFLSQSNTKKLDKKIITVNGMSCNHCKTSVEKHINALQNISSAEVNLELKTLKIEGKDIDIQAIRDVVEGLGYNFGGIK